MRPTDKTFADASRDRALWIVLCALALAQVVAFWMLCNQQVRNAEVRTAAVQLERTARNDCLQYLPGSAPAACAPRNVHMDNTVAVNWVR